jgi:hypothetical protein
VVLQIGALLGIAGSWLASAAGTVVRAAASPAGQAILKGVLDVGTGLVGTLTQGGGRPSNPNAVGRRPQLAAYAPAPGGSAQPAFLPGRVYSTMGDVSGGANMALLGAPVLTAARTALGAIASRVGSVLTSPTVRSVATGAAGAYAAERLLSPSMPGTLRMRVPSRLFQMDEATGRQLSYAYEGRPVLYSRDIAVVRRVRRVQGTLNRLLPHGGSRRFR